MEAGCMITAAQREVEVKTKRLEEHEERGVKSADGWCRIRRQRERETVSQPDLQLSCLDLNWGHMGPKSSKTGSHEP